jgi:hypothetical protein
MEFRGPFSDVSDYVCGFRELGLYSSDQGSSFGLPRQMSGRTFRTCPSGGKQGSGVLPHRLTINVNSGSNRASCTSKMKWIFHGFASTFGWYVLVVQEVVKAE